MSAVESKAPAERPTLARVWEVFLVATRLGLTSFGGPIAHLGYFRSEYVVRRKWLDERTYADVVAFCQVMPGPASSQVGMSIGLMRAGIPGAVAAWVGFTLPSAALMIAFAYGVAAFNVTNAGWLRGLLVAAVAVVAQAVWGMARSLAPDRPRATIAIAAAVLTLILATAWAQVIVLVGAGLIGWRLLKPSSEVTSMPGLSRISRPFALGCLMLVFCLLVTLPIARALVANQALAVFDSFFRAGSLVFGGGHVVLPLLQKEVVPPGWVSQQTFLAGYAAAQAMPGPLFTFATYLGAAMHVPPNGIAGGLLATMAVFLPSLLLVLGGLPFWDQMRSSTRFQSVLLGLNAGVVGILLAALYNPVWTSAILTPADFCLALAAFGLLMFWRVPSWAVVALAAGVGQIIAWLY